MPNLEPKRFAYRVFAYLISLKRRCAQQFIPAAKRCFHLIGQRLVQLAKLGARVLKRLIAWLSRFSRLIARYAIQAVKLGIRSSGKIAAWAKRCFHLIGQRLVQLAKLGARVLKRLIAWLSRFSRLIARYAVQAVKFGIRSSGKIAVWAKRCFHLIGQRLVQLAKFSARVLKRLIAWLSRFSRLIARYAVQAVKLGIRSSGKIIVWIKRCFYLVGRRLVQLAKLGARILKKLIAWLSRFSRLIARYAVQAVKLGIRSSGKIIVWIKRCFYLVGRRLVQLAKLGARILKRLIAWLKKVGSTLSVTIKTKWFFLQDRLTQYCYLMRLDKPIGIFLLLWPVLWALWMAAEGAPDLSILLVFIAGVVLMRSAGCVINDLADRNFDRQVKRTGNRPITSGKVKPAEAIGLSTALLIGAGLLVLSLNPLTFKLSFIALALALIYPFMKRYTYLPQVFLGLAFGWGVPMAFAAQTNDIPQVAWLVFIAVVLWAMVYDTMYAMVDREDDLRIGIKSTAILFDDADRLFIAVIQVMVLLALTLAGAKLALGRYYFAGLGIAALLFLYQQFLIKDRTAENCFRGFMNNNWCGAAIFAGVYFHYLIG